MLPLKEVESVSGEHLQVHLIAAKETPKLRKLKMRKKNKNITQRKIISLFLPLRTLPSGRRL
jgi:hypothetical protein